MSQEREGNCSEKLVQMNFFILGGFFRVDFPPLINRNAALLCLVSEIAAISGVRDRHRNRKSQKSLRFRCAKPRTLKDPAVLRTLRRSNLLPP